MGDRDQPASLCQMSRLCHNRPGDRLSYLCRGRRCSWERHQLCGDCRYRLYADGREGASAGFALLLPGALVDWLKRDSGTEGARLHLGLHPASRFLARCRRGFQGSDLLLGQMAPLARLEVAQVKRADADAYVPRPPASLISNLFHGSGAYGLRAIRCAATYPCQRESRDALRPGRCGSRRPARRRAAR